MTDSSERKTHAYTLLRFLKAPVCDMSSFFPLPVIILQASKIFLNVRVDKEECMGVQSI